MTSRKIVLWVAPKLEENKDILAERFVSAIQEGLI